MQCEVMQQQQQQYQQYQQKQTANMLTSLSAVWFSLPACIHVLWFGASLTLSLCLYHCEMYK